MSGSADEFCVVEPLALVDDDLVQHSGISRGIEGIAFGEKEQAGTFVAMLDNVRADLVCTKAPKRRCLHESAKGADGPA